MRLVTNVEYVLNNADNDDFDVLQPCNSWTTLDGMSHNGRRIVLVGGIGVGNFRSCSLYWGMAFGDKRSVGTNDPFLGFDNFLALLRPTLELT